MKTFVITEKQVRIVVYRIEAENEHEARDAIGAADVNGYDELIDVPEIEIIAVSEEAP